MASPVGSALSARVRVALAAIVAAGAALLVATGVLAAPWGSHASIEQVAAFAVLGPAYLIPAVLIVRRRPDNVIGWVLAIVGLLFGVHAMAAAPEWSRAPGLAQTLHLASAGLWAPPIFVLLSTIPIVFPDGHLPSSRWRAAMWAGALGSVVVVLTFPFDPEYTHPDPNPIANATIFAIGFVAPWFGLGGAAAAMVAMVRRYRRAHGVDRVRMKFLVFAVVVGVALMLAVGLLSTLLGTAAPGWLVAALFVVAAAGIAASVGVALLRHRMLDIDLVISKTLVYGVLAASVTAAYFGIAAGIGSLDWPASAEGEPSRGLTAVLTAAAVLGLLPLRTRVQRAANRFVYGTRATPYEALSHLSQQLREAFSGATLLERVAEIVAHGTGATQVHVWARAGSVLRSVAAWPPEPVAREESPPDGDPAAIPGVTLAVPIEHAGEHLGALTIAKPANDPPSSTQRRLLADIGAQAGLLLRNEGLTAQLRANLDELTASRQRLVRAQDLERRRIERDLHDGAQQLLVALKIKAGMAARERSQARARAMLAEIEAESGEALDALRDLARGIYPPLLTSQGLASALLAHVEKAATPVSFETAGVGRYPREAEAAVYFCVVEALQNVQKHAAGARATVRLTEADGLLLFSVADDGPGFDAVAVERGSGTTNMADRLAALGGSLAVTSAPGAGTMVSGQIPVGPSPERHGVADGEARRPAAPEGPRPEATAAP